MARQRFRVNYGRLGLPGFPRTYLAHRGHGAAERPVSTSGSGQHRAGRRRRVFSSRVTAVEGALRKPAGDRPDREEPPRRAEEGGGLRGSGAPGGTGGPDRRSYCTP